MIIKGTSCYENAKSGNLVSITGDGGNAWGFYGNAYKKLAPRLYLWKYYDENPDKLSEDELIDWYVTEYYNSRLKELDPHKLMDKLQSKFGDEIILLCHELPSTQLCIKHFCHRRLFADWIELETGIIIPELIINDSQEINVDTYDLKPKLKKLIK